MRLVIQRVSKAKVTVNQNTVGEIKKGFLILVGIESGDTQLDADWLVDKVAGLRVFSDDHGKMNLGIKEISGSVLAISQFTLHESTVKGNRPSFIRAASAQVAKDLYDSFSSQLTAKHSIPVEKGIFGADMQVELINDGPVTILMDSKNRE